MKKQLPTLLDYNSGKGILPEGAIRISASSISRFLSHTNQWWRENLLGEDKEFIGNQGSLIGSCTHRILEQYAINQSISSEDTSEIDKYILKSTDEDYVDFIPKTSAGETEKHYKIMSTKLINDYLQDNMPVCVEPFITSEIAPNIFAGGSVDALYNGQNLTTNNIEDLRDSKQMTVCDYKTIGVKPQYVPKSITFPYKLQLLTYAYVLKKEYNIHCDRIRIIYVTKEQGGGVSEKTGKPLKTYPSEVITLTELITPEDMEMITGIIHLISESIQAYQENPNLLYLLAQDYRLKAPN